MSDQSWVGVAQRSLPPTYAQTREAERKLDAIRKDDKVMETAIESEWISSAAQRYIERDKEFTPTEGYQVPQEVQDELSREWGFELSREITKGVTSEEELNFRLGNANADKKRAEVLARNGITGVAAQLAASVLDPAGWAASMVAAPVAGAIKVKRIGHVFKTAALAGAENAAIEAILAENDYTRGADDVLTAAGFGMMMGGTIGAVTRKTAKGIDRPAGTPEPHTATVVDGADEFDKAASVAVRDAMEYDAYMAVRNYEPMKARDIDADLTIHTHIEKLKADSKVRMSASEKGGLKKEIRELEAEIASMGGRKTDEIAAAAAEVGVTKTKGERLNLDVARSVLARKYDEPIKDMTSRVDELKAKLAQVEGVAASKAELKRFTNLEREAMIKELGLDVEPRKVEMVSAVRDAIKALKAERKPTPTMKHDESIATEAKAAAKKDDSIGAARVKDSEIQGEQFDLSESMEDLMDTLAREAYTSAVKPIKWAGNAGSVSSVILNSQNPVFRGLGLRLLENAQGGAYHGKTASILSNVNGNIIRSAEKNRYNDGFSQFIKDNGMSAKDYLSPATTRDFNNQIYTAIVKGIPADTPRGVKLAAEGIADKLAKSLELRKSAGEKGFEDVQSAVDYMPVIYDGIKVTQAINRMGSQEAVIDLLSKGYQTGKYKMGKKAADALAKVQLVRASDSTLSGRVAFDRVISQQQQAQLIEDLRKAGLPDSIIDNFIEGNELQEMAESVSNRAKASMGINTQAEVNGVRVQDLLNTNVGELAENYGKEAAGGAALARMGFPTRQAIYNAIDAGERAGRNMVGNDAKAIKQLRAESDMLRDAVRMMYGNTIDADPNSGIVKGTRRVREITGLLRLQQMGFAQIPEIARAITKMGLGTVLQSVPATKFLRSRAAREGATAQGVLREPELREMEELMGYIGEDNWLSGWNVRHDEFGESADNVGRLSALVDNGLAMGSRVNTWLSGFKAIQGGSEKIVARSINKRLKEHLSGTRQLPQKDLDEVGLSEDVMKRLKRHFDDNPAHADYNGEKVRMMNFDAMEPDLRETVGVAVRRMSGRLIQRNFIGDEGMWMNKWWGKAISQFKSFSIVSIEKQLIHDLRGDKIAAAQIFAWSALLGLASYSAQMQLQAIGRADRDKFLDDKFSAHNMAMGVFNKLPQVAGFSLGGDALATLGLMPDSMMQAPGRMGFQRQGFGELVAGAGVIGDAVDLGNAFSKYATGDDDIKTRQLVDKVRRLVPFANSIGVGQMTKAGVDLLEE